jgi:phosphoribosyl 1,2-cyclic phosphate phosphodiesterase
MNLKQALSFIEEIGPEEAFLIHISHKMGRYTEVQPALPPGVQLAFDGLEIPL